MISIESTRRRGLAWPAAFLGLAIGTAGCGQSAPVSDATQGREALRSALDAWKGGEKPATLSERTPPIHVSDVDWTSGYQLQNYKAVDDGKLVGSDVNYSVALELKDTKGNVIKREAVYAVTTRPKVLVVRQDNL